MQKQDSGNEGSGGILTWAILQQVANFGLGYGVRQEHPPEGHPVQELGAHVWVQLKHGSACCFLQELRRASPRDRVRGVAAP